MSCTLETNQPLVASRLANPADRFNTRHSFSSKEVRYTSDGSSERRAHLPAVAHLMTASAGQDEIPRLDPDLRIFAPARSGSRTAGCSSITPSMSHARFSFPEDGDQQLYSAAGTGPPRPYTGQSSAHAQHVSFQQAAALPLAQPAPASTDSILNLLSSGSDMHAVQRTSRSMPPEAFSEVRAASYGSKQPASNVVHGGGKPPSEASIVADHTVHAQRLPMQGRTDAAGAKAAKQGFASRFLKRAVASSAQLFGIAGQAAQPHPPQQGVASKHRQHA